MSKTNNKPYKKTGNKILNKKIFFASGSLCLLIIAGLGLFYISESKNYPGLSIWQIYQNLANPTVRYVNISEGMRKEEVADRFAKVLGWNDDQKKQLIAAHTLAMRGATEGYYFPDTYLVPLHAKPEDVSKEIADTFNKEIIQKNAQSNINIINMDAAIKIASIIQREAGNKSDMRIISGIIWNRLFNGMTLDMDATLQYAKGTNGKWWPQVNSEDKFINSPYNTYKNKGLPPSAISNPGEAAINAALSPVRTDALFYIHDKSGRIHTAKTYEQQVANVDRYY